VFQVVMKLVVASGVTAAWAGVTLINRSGRVYRARRKKRFIRVIWFINKTYYIRR
jgi:hypothetical protein